jgi:hypothetical protein
MISHVGGIVRMPVGELWNERFEGVQQVEIRAWVQIGDRQCRGRMKDKEVANPRFDSVAGELFAAELGDVNNLTFTFRADL